MVGDDLKKQPKGSVVPAHGPVAQAELGPKPEEGDSQRDADGETAGHDDFAEDDVFEGQIMPVGTAVLAVGIKKAEDGDDNEKFDEGETEPGFW